MSFDALKDVAITVTFRPESLWVSPSCQVLKPSGGEAETPTATVDTTSTTISAAADSKSLTLVSSSGVSVGSRYLVTSTGWTAVCEVTTIDGNDVTLTTGLPRDPVSGDTFRGIDITAPIAAATLDDYGANWRIRVYKDQQEIVSYFNVVRHNFQDPATEEDVRRLVNEIWRTKELTPETYREVAQEATQMVRQRLLGMARYPYLQGDSDALKPAGRLAIRLVLIDYGVKHPGWDIAEYEERYYERFKEAMGDLVQSLSPYDRDNDDDLEDEPTAVTNVRLLI